jgi:hypothetical protein
MAVMLTIIAVMLAVPMMVVFAAAALAIPVAAIEALSLVARTDPACAAIWRTSPVPAMPMVAAPHRIPVSFHPCEFRTWPRRENPDHPRRWRRSDFYPN